MTGTARSLVELAVSGAWSWTPQQRSAFANDLSDRRSLRAVTAASNRSKSERDPSNWIPPNGDDLCRYLGDWVAIKARWKLSMDPSEWGRIKNLLRDRCSGQRIAAWPVASTVAAPAVTPQPPPTPPPTAPPPPAPPLPPAPEANVLFENCDAARAAGAAPVRRGDPGYASDLDGDDDGIGCE